MKIHIGHKIEEVYEESGLKMEVFSSRVGMSPRNYYKIIEKENINTDLLARIGKALNYNFFELYTEKDENAANEPQAEYKTKETKSLEISLNIKFNDDKKQVELLKLLFGDQIPESFKGYL